MGNVKNVKANVGKLMSGDGLGSIKYSSKTKSEKVATKSSFHM